MLEDGEQGSQVQMIFQF